MEVAQGLATFCRNAQMTETAAESQGVRYHTPLPEKTFQCQTLPLISTMSDSCRNYGTSSEAVGQTLRAFCLTCSGKNAHEPDLAQSAPAAPADCAECPPPFHCGTNFVLRGVCPAGGIGQLGRFTPVVLQRAPGDRSSGIGRRRASPGGIHMRLDRFGRCMACSQLY